MSAPMKRWLIGAANALASGLFATGGAQYAGASLKQTIIIAIFAGVGSFGKWMVQHPLPDPEDTPTPQPKPAPIPIKEK